MATSVAMRIHPSRAGVAAVLSLVISVGACSSPPPPAVASGPTTSTERFQPTTWTFDKETVGGLPAGATSFFGQWAVRAEPGTPSAPNALCQTASADYPAMQLSNESHKDMSVTAQVKPISGRTDQAAGVLLRIRDAKNYYIVRANALEGSVVIFKYVDGSRSEIRSGAVSVASGVWQQLRGEAIGTTLRGYLGGKLIVEATDATFSEGRAGLWTKADSVTCFDDVVLAPVGGQ
ncbi:MAG TPA: hypothetical protein VEP48_02550 [Methylomirabilota bacterium]|nr:hypothetical protein [Methylomirabilota bacterium]